MTPAQMAAAIIQYIQTDANLILVLRMVVSNNLPGSDPIKMQALITALNIPPAS